MMEQLERLKLICQDTIAKEPSNPTEREKGYTIALQHVLKILEDQLPLNQDYSKINNMKPTIRTWLSNVYYNKEDQRIYNRVDDKHIQPILDIRGWGRIQNEFPTQEEASKFQDEVGEFVADAIRQKLIRLKK